MPLTLAEPKEDENLNRVPYQQWLIYSGAGLKRLNPGRRYVIEAYDGGILAVVVDSVEQAQGNAMFWVHCSNSTSIFTISSARILRVHGPMPDADRVKKIKTIMLSEYVRGCNVV